MDKKCLINVAYPHLCLDATIDPATYRIGMRNEEGNKQNMLIVPIDNENIEECII